LILTVNGDLKLEY